MENLKLDDPQTDGKINRPTDCSEEEEDIFYMCLYVTSQHITNVFKLEIFY